MGQNYALIKIILLKVLKYQYFLVFLPHNLTAIYI